MRRANLLLLALHSLNATTLSKVSTGLTEMEPILIGFAFSECNYVDIVEIDSSFEWFE